MGGLYINWAKCHCHNDTSNHANFHTVLDCSNRRNIECLCEEAIHILSTKSREGIKPGTERNGTEPEVIVVQYAGRGCWTRGQKFRTVRLGVRTPISR